MGGEIGTAAALGMAVSNLFWDAASVVLVLAALALACWVTVAVRLMREAGYSRRRTPTQPNQVIDVVAERRAPRRGCDEETFLADGMATALNQMLREDGRG